MSTDLKTLFTPRSSVFSPDRRAIVLNLDNFLSGTIIGEEFFNENYITQGMKTLVERTFLQLGGSKAGSSVFLLSQSMGGGKTHSMMALGLLARDPKLRAQVFPDLAPSSVGEVRVIGFHGRNTDVPLGIWGELSRQLGKQDQFREYFNPTLKAPGPGAWKELLGGQPTIVLLDELPAYMENAQTVSVGNADLSVVTTTALSNLLVAASELEQVIIVISDLSGTSYHHGGALLQQSLSNLKNETGRIALTITPVNPQGDELFHILRCRLFERIPQDKEIQAVAQNYREAHVEAVKMGLTTSVSDGLYQNILESYPFHPSWRELIGRFKENQDFQQTRGVIRLMQMVVGNLWKTENAGSTQLIHPYDVDLADLEIGSEIRSINQTLSEAIAHDISHEGDAEAEKIDQKNGNKDATEATRLLLFASLSTTPGSVAGLREFELYDYLQKPGRDLSTFKLAVLDQLDTRAWYLHRSQDDRLYFKNQQNLAAKLRSTAQGLHPETVTNELRDYLGRRFEIRVRDVYQSLAILPGLDEVQLEIDKVTLVLAEPVAGKGGLPLSPEWQGWWQQQTFKNRVMFLSGSKMVMDNVRDATRQYRALKGIEDELRAEGVPANDPQWRSLDTLKDRIQIQMASALTQAFDNLVFPSINEELRSTNIDLEFKGNAWFGEEVVRKTLTDGQKFTSDITSDVFRTKAESRLFVSNPTQWSEVKRQTATKTLWQFHRPDALELLKTECLRKDLWRTEGDFINKGPFPKSDTSLGFKVLSIDQNGSTWLKIDPRFGDAVHFEKGDNHPTTASPRVTDFQRFEATGLRYRFLCVDSKGEHPTGPEVEWIGKPELKYDFDSTSRKITLKATPSGKIRYSTNGMAPNLGAVYDSAFILSKDCRIFLAQAEAEGIYSTVLQFTVPDSSQMELFKVDPVRPCTWKFRHKLDDSGMVWKWIEDLKKYGGVAHNIVVSADNNLGDQTIEFSGAKPGGYSEVDLQNLCNQMQELAGPGSVRLDCSEVTFAQAQGLLDWLQATGQSVNGTQIQQGDPLA